MAGLFPVVVESVNGLTVTTTQGYTLTRIGNKSLREGDTIYTDGKYVYGMEGNGGKQLPMLPSVNYYYMSYRHNAKCICGFANSFNEPKLISKIGDYKRFFISSGGCWLYDYNNDYINVLTRGKIPYYNEIVSHLNQYLSNRGTISSILKCQLHDGNGFYHGVSYDDFLDVSVDGKGNLINLSACYVSGHQIHEGDPFIYGSGAALLINGKVSNIDFFPFKECVYGNFYNDTDYQLIFLPSGPDKDVILYDSKGGKSIIGSADASYGPAQLRNFSCDLKIGIGIDGEPITMHCSGDYFSYYKDDYGLNGRKGITCDCMGYKIQGICSLRSACQIDADKYIFSSDDGIVLFNKKSKKSRVLDNSLDRVYTNPHIVKLPYDMKNKIKRALQNSKL